MNQTVRERKALHKVSMLDQHYRVNSKKEATTYRLVLLGFGAGLLASIVAYLFVSGV